MPPWGAVFAGLLLFCSNENGPVGGSDARGSSYVWWDEGESWSPESDGAVMFEAGPETRNC